MENKLSLSEFSKLISVNIQTISKAIKQNKIPSQFAEKMGKVVLVQPKAAAVTWLKNLSGTTQATHDLRKRLEEYLKTFINDPEPEIEKPSNKEHRESTDSPAKIRYSDSQNKEKYFKAQLAELEYQEKLGTLVDKSKVQFQLFNMGKEIRNSFLAIPDRISDELFACQNRAQVHKLLYETIEFELGRIANLGLKDIE